MTPGFDVIETAIIMLQDYLKPWSYSLKPARNLKWKGQYHHWVNHPWIPHYSALIFNNDGTALHYYFRGSTAQSTEDPHQRIGAVIIAEICNPVVFRIIVNHIIQDKPDTILPLPDILPESWPDNYTRHYAWPNCIDDKDFHQNQKPQKP